MKKNWIKIVVCIVGILVVAYFMPFIGSTATSKESGITFDVPFLSTYKEDCCNYSVSFQNIRSTYALRKDMENAVAGYKTVSCYGKTYHYDEANDITINEYGVNSGFPFNTLYYTYDKGNVCEGWTNDDEIAYAFTPLKDIPQTYSIEDAVEDKYFVVTRNGIRNEAVYNDFQNNLKHTMMCFMRVVEETNDGIKIMDIQYLEDSTFKITIDVSRDKTSEEKEKCVTLAYDNVSEFTDEDGNTFLFAYNGNDSQTEDRLVICQVNE